MAQFPSMLAQDESGTLAQGLTGFVYAVDDFGETTPLDIFTSSGAAFQNNALTSGPYGVLPSFSCPGHVVVRWISGPYKMEIPAVDQVPSGGTTGQILAKTTDSNFELEWIDVPSVAAGGTTGQVLAKASGANFDTHWVTAASGGSTGSFINVKDAAYGAVGDGVADDRAAIQAALDAVPVGGGLVYFPPGDYGIGNTLEVKVEGTLIMGSGAGNRIGATQTSIGTRVKALTGLTGSMFRVQRAADDRPMQGVHFRDITVDGNNIGTGVNGITFRVNQGSMHSVHVWNCSGTGISVKGYSSPAWDTYDTEFAGVKVGYCATGAELGTGGADTQWSNCVFLSNTDNFIVRGSSPQFSNCHFYTAGRYAIWFDGNGSRGKFTGCKIEGSKNHMVYIDTTNGGYSDIQFTGCGFSSLSQTSIPTNTYDYVHITGPSGNGASRFTFIANSFNLKGGGTVKARYAINATGSTVQNLILAANSFGPLSHWGTAAFNQGSNSSLLPFVRGNWNVPDLYLTNTQTANYTVSAGDCETTLVMDSATAVTVTIPPNDQPGFMKGIKIEVLQKGAGQVTFQAGPGVTLNTPRSLTTRAQYSTVTLWQRSTNSWVLEGDLT